MREVIGLVIVLVLVLVALMFAIITLGGPSPAGKVPPTSTEKVIPSTKAKVTRSSSEFGASLSEVCYDGIVYVVYNDRGITPKINSNNTPYTCIEESSK